MNTTKPETRMTERQRDDGHCVSCESIHVVEQRITTIQNAPRLISIDRWCGDCGAEQ